ncbi:hypothetical protein STEG23_035923, partial [Scotinomys teguina]
MDYGYEKRIFKSQHNGDPCIPLMVLLVSQVLWKCGFLFILTPLACGTTLNLCDKAYLIMMDDLLMYSSILFQVGNLTQPFTNCRTEKEPCALPGQHRSIDPVDRHDVFYEILKLPAYFLSIIYQSHHYLVLEGLSDPYGIG